MTIFYYLSTALFNCSAHSSPVGGGKASYIRGAKAIAIQREEEMLMFAGVEGNKEKHLHCLPCFWRNVFLFQFEVEKTTKRKKEGL